jgi:hypothetical protein
MQHTILDSGSGYTITAYADGDYRIAQEATGKTTFLRGDEALLFRAEYDDLLSDHTKPNTRASRFTWTELLDTMCGCYFD